ncbi:MAG: signal peptide peptidase SppA [Ignavibacteriales bacterium]
MKQFFKFMFASMLGTFLMIIITAVIFFTFVVIAVSGLQREKTESIPSHSIIKIKLDYSIPDRTSANPFPGIFSGTLSMSRKLGLNDIIQNIRKAKNDQDVDGIYLDLNNFMPGGMATVEAIRRELVDFKRSRKFIIAFGNDISQNAYYLGSVADRIYLNPEGGLDFKGISAELVFFKKTLDKLEIEPQIFQYGKYKSATEPFKFDRMSEDNKKQTTELLNSIYGNMIKMISESRHIPQDELNKISTGLLIRTPEDATKLHFIDSLIYSDQVMDELKAKTVGSKSNRLSLVSIEDYNDVTEKSSYSGRNRVAVIYANGDIQNTQGSETVIGTENIAEAIRTAREDKNIRAIVMRVNSPGGDALVADEIWREVVRAKKEKPFIISMGNYAASGGYYIACAADTIVAEPNTITGSIGVFGIIPNMEGFFKNKLGITFDRVKTGKYSDLGSTTRPFSAEEKAIIQKEIDRVYETFVKKVADGRKKTFAQVDDIAQGRVWTGVQAKERGLVDIIGGLDDAVKVAASRAKIGQFSIVEYPRKRGFLKSILEDISSETEESIMKLKLGDNFRYYKSLQQATDLQGVQARLPYDIGIY